MESHFITKYLQIGPRASRLVLGFFVKRKPIHVVTFESLEYVKPKPIPNQRKPPNPTPCGVFGKLMGVSSYLFGHGLVAAAPGHGQVALGTKKAARTWTGAGPGPGGARTQRHFLRPQRHLAMAWRRRRQAMGRPVTGNAQSLGTP